MANTPRTLSELLVIAADNSTGNISAQDLRDMLVSLYPSRGALQLVAPASTTITTADTWTRLAGTTALDANVCSTCVTMPENGALQLTKQVEQVVLATASLTFLISNSNRTIAFTFGKNGTPIERAAVSSFYGAQTSGDGYALVTSALIPTLPGDQIELYVKNVNHTDAINSQVLEFSVLGFIK